MRKSKPGVVLQQLMVEDYAAEGKALAKTEGKVVFISGAVPGDIVDVQLSKNKKDWAEGKAIHFHSYSKDRVPLFVNILGFAAAANGRCCPTISNCSISKMR